MKRSDAAPACPRLRSPTFHVVDPTAPPCTSPSRAAAREGTSHHQRPAVHTESTATRRLQSSRNRDRMASQQRRLSLASNPAQFVRRPGSILRQRVSCLARSLRPRPWSSPRPGPTSAPVRWQQRVSATAHRPVLALVPPSPSSAHPPFPPRHSASASARDGPRRLESYRACTVDADLESCPCTPAERDGEHASCVWLDDEHRRGGMRSTTSTCSKRR